jgi:hypothetical protein
VEEKQKDHTVPALYHGTLLENVPAILERGIERGEGWGGAGTSGAFLSKTPQGALYWAKIAYQRDRNERMEILHFDRDHGYEIDKLLAILVVQIPDDQAGLLRADEEQFEDVGADFPAEDWRQSLEKIGDVRFEGEIPPAWVVDVKHPVPVHPKPAPKGAKKVSNQFTPPLTWTRCSDGLVYKGVKSVENPDNYLETDEAAFYVNLGDRTAWFVSALRETPSIWISAVDLDEPREVIDKLPLATSLHDPAMEHLVKVGAFMEFMGELEEMRNAELSLEEIAEKFERIPKLDRLALLEVVHDVAGCLLGNQKKYNLRLVYEKQTIHGEAAKILAEHGIYC